MWKIGDAAISATDWFISSFVALLRKTVEAIQYLGPARWGYAFQWIWSSVVSTHFHSIRQTCRKSTKQFSFSYNTSLASPPPCFPFFLNFAHRCIFSASKQFDDRLKQDNRARPSFSNGRKGAGFSKITRRKLLNVEYLNSVESFQASRSVWMDEKAACSERSPPLYQDLRERGRGRDRERDWSFCIFSKISLSRLKAAGCNLFALTFSFAKTLLLFFFFFTRHALFTLFRPPERGNFLLLRGYSHPAQVPTFAQLRVEPRSY